MDFLYLISQVLTLFLAIPTSVFVVEVLLASEPQPSTAHDQATPRPRVAVLIPAHDEERVIQQTLDSIMPQLMAEDSVLVVADNCSDRTAELAKISGAWVIERQNLTQRGKGYALDFGLQSLATNQPPEVVIVIDADCQLSAGGIAALARQVMRHGRPVQALDLMWAPADSGVALAVAEFAWLLKNQVRAMGLMRLGWPCPLMGTGMAFPWPLIRSAQLAHGNMVEDMKLGIDLALGGHPALFCPQVRVTSEFPTSEHVAYAQRKRWEHGHLATILAEVPRLIVAALRNADMKLLAMALDLAVPPLSALGLSLLAMGFVGMLFAFFFARYALLWLGAGLLGLFIVAVLLAWYRYGRARLPFAMLRSVPLYVLKKVPLYLGFLFRRQQVWVKTDRD